MTSSGRSQTDSKPLVSYVIATYGRPDELVDAVESVVAQDYRPLELFVVGDTAPAVRAMFEEGGRFDRDWIEFTREAERTSPAHSKNVGFERASGEYLIHIDDDAELADPDATRTVLDVFDRHPDVGVISFQSKDPETHEVKLEETPDTPVPGMEPTRPYLAPNFVGVGAAIRRSVLETAGTYPDEFGYGFEEMDLSLRVHDTGYDILYTPEVVVYHKKSDAGRIPDLETKERLVENRINIAVRNLPWRYVFFTALIWSVYAIVNTRRIRSLVRIYTRIYRKHESLLEARSVVSPATIARIKSRKTMLFLWWYGPHPRRIVGPNGELDRLTWEN
ncbi:glycosyltransferase family 2 protein [Halobaculum marinum]|uniref:Glycosyltransferase family 2 protein n=1 Tax=Halobaculum marinum TaxID=3031996 RepID=A0ABD5WU97_9EURY|nr:glycosyltransferase family 2 protein [Halobaculum sp. DT55]